jgi:hypothetical protein
MYRKLCLSKQNNKLYKLLCEATDAACGGDAIHNIPLVFYHYIENNDLIFTMEKAKFDNEFVRLKIVM